MSDITFSLQIHSTSDAGIASRIKLKNLAYKNTGKYGTIHIQ